MTHRRRAPSGASPLGHRLMETLYQHRLVSTRQIHHLLTPGARTSESVRAQLHDLRDRGLAECTLRRRWGRGDLLWWATPLGAEAVEAARELVIRPYRMTEHAAAGPLQEHTLAVTETGLAFVEWARRLGHECGPLDWTPELAHRMRDGEGRFGEDAFLVSDAVLSYVHTAGRQRTLLTYFLEIDRGTKPVALLAAQLSNYARYYTYVPQPTGRFRGRGARPPAAREEWRNRYATFPRVLTVLTGRETDPERLAAQLARRTSDLRSMASANPLLTDAVGRGLRLGVTTLQQLRERGPFADIFTPLLEAATPVDAFLHASAAA